MKKGMSLPINMIVVVAIAVLVLVVVAGFFAGWFTGGISTISLQDAFNKGCDQLRAQYNCNSNGVGSVYVQYQQAGDNGPQRYPFAGICALKLGLESKITTDYDSLEDTDKERCVKQCGCVILGGE